MEKQIKEINSEELKQLIQDVTLLKEILLSSFHKEDPEGELSDWAKKELAQARKTPKEEYISMEEIEKEFL